jgi:hypothetical protein
MILMLVLNMHLAIHLEIHGVLEGKLSSKLLYSLEAKLFMLQVGAGHTLKVKPIDGRMSHLNKRLKKCQTKTPKPFVSLKT